MWAGCVWYMKKCWLFLLVYCFGLENSDQERGTDFGEALDLEEVAPWRDKKLP